MIIYFLNLAGYTPAEYDLLYLNETNSTKYPGHTHRGQSYDTMWVIALALNDTDKKLKEMGTLTYFYRLIRVPRSAHPKSS